MEYVNWDRIKTFANMDDASDLEWLKETIQDLRKNMEEKIFQVQEALNQNNRESLGTICHQIKGVTSNFGLDRMHELSLKAEKFLKTEEWRESIPLFHELDSLWKSTDEEFHRVLNI